MGASLVDVFFSPACPLTGQLMVLSGEEHSPVTLTNEVLSNKTCARESRKEIPQAANVYGTVH